MVGKLKEEAWTLNSNDTVTIPSGNRADGTANSWSDLWKYQVPTGQAHILQAKHRFAAYIEDDSPAQVGNGTCRLKIEVRDQSESDKQRIYEGLYVASKEFQQDDKMARLLLTKDLLVEEKWFIVIMVLDDGTVDESDSYFKLETIRLRTGL